MSIEISVRFLEIFALRWLKFTYDLEVIAPWEDHFSSYW